MDVVKVTPAHIVEVANRMGHDIGQIPINPVGYAALVDGEVRGVGFVLFASDGTLWGMCHAMPDVFANKAMVHRLASTLVMWCRMCGHTLHVTRDERFSTSARWLAHLGFKPTGETLNNQEVWACPGVN